MSITSKTSFNKILLGHSNISITLDTYTHVLDSMKERVASKLNDLYNSIVTKLFFM